MAILEWVGNAPSVTQVDSVTVDAVAAQDYELTVNNKVIVYTHPGGGTAEDVVDGLLAAWLASTYPEVTEITATKDDVTPALVLTGYDTWPFTVVDSGANLTITPVSTASGPNHWGNQYNYRNLTTGASSATPALSDEIHFLQVAPAILHGLEAISATVLGRFYIAPSVNIEIGLSERNPRGYDEYRPTYLKQKTSAIEFRGSTNRLQIDLNTHECHVTINGSVSYNSENQIGLQLENSDGTAGTLQLLSGMVVLNRRPTSLGGFDAVHVSNGRCEIAQAFNTSPAQVADVVVEIGGVLECASDCSIEVRDGSASFRNLFGMTALTLTGSAVVDGKELGDVTTLVMDSERCVLDMSNNPGAIAVTNYTFNSGRVIDPNGVITWGAGTMPAGTITVEP